MKGNFIFFRQLSILFSKGFLLSIRNWKLSVGQIFAPVLICLLLFGTQLLSNYVLNRPIDNPPLVEIGTIPRCHPRYPNNCSTILYGPPNVPWVETVMREVARRNHLHFETDFTPYHPLFPPPPTWPLGYPYYITLFEMFDNFLHHENITQLGILFKSAFDPKWNGSVVPPDPGYHVFYNSTAPNTFIMETTKSLAEAILSVKLNRSITYDITKKDYPYTNRINTYDVVAANGATWFFVPPMITFFIVLTEMVTEKENKLRLGMRMMGLANGPYYVVWWFYGLIFTTMSTLVLIGTGYAFQFDYFWNSNPICVFLLFFIFGMSITAFSMFLASVIQTAGAAQTVGYALILVGFVFQILLSLGNGLLVNMMWSVTAAPWVVFLRVLLTFYPPFNMAKVFNDIGSKASSNINFINGTVNKGPGFFWKDMFEGFHQTVFKIEVDAPMPIITLTWLFASTFFYLLLMWYLDNILPGEHGSPKPFYFMFTRAYWGCAKKPIRNDDLNASAVNGSNIDASFPLRVEEISKVYQKSLCCRGQEDVIAVDGVSLDVESDSILCLLGHNGAGKTTLVNMLTGLFDPTSGRALIYGLDITERMDDIRQLLGVCPQHDILWDELTAREHLEIFSKLKGLTQEESASQIEVILEKVNLAEVADNRVSSYSGGMKRRLSIGISTIGNPTLIFMDEPTTGLDPVNRRKIWHMIQDLKKDRAIVLTTHSMEEADILSDKVAIMTKGRLRCIGTSLFLKNKFGGGSRITIISYQSALLISELQSRWPLLKLEESEAGSLQFTIPTELAESTPEILTFLETASDDKLIQEWGLSHATLEEVFLKVTKENEDFRFATVVDDERSGEEPLHSSDGDDVVQLDQDEPVYDAKDGRSRSRSPKTKRLSNSDSVKYADLQRNTYPLRALFRKNFHFQKRQYVTNVCQILTPVIVVILMLILQVVVKAQIPGGNAEVSIVNVTVPYPLNSPFSLDDLLSIRDKLNFTFPFQPPTEPIPPAPHHYNVTMRDDCLLFFLFTDHLSKESAGRLDPDGTKSGILGEMYQNRCGIHNGTHHLVHVSYWEKRNSSATILKELLDDVDLYNQQPFKDFGPPFRYIMPDGAVDFLEINSSTYKLNATISVNSNFILAYHRANNFTRSQIKMIPSNTTNPEVQKLEEIIPIGYLQLFDLVTRAFANYSLKAANETPLGWMEDSMDSARFFQAMPFTFDPDILRFIEAAGALLYPIAMTLQLPVYTYLLVLEKKKKLTEMMKMHGMKDWHYYFTNYCFCFFLYSVVAAFFWVSGILVKLRFFSQTAPDTLIVYYLGWGLSLVSLSFFLSAFLSDPRAATVACYAVALIGTLVCISICIGIYGPFPFSIPQWLPQWTYLWPQFSFVRATYLMNFACATNLHCYEYLHSFFDLRYNELSGCLLAMYCTGVGYFVLFLYLDQVLPREYGIAKHPLFFIPYFNKAEDARPLSESEQPLIAADPIIENEDCDVAEQRKKIRQGKWNPSDPLVINELRKQYNASKVALKSLSFSVSKDQCFGLLGENGAGKTTTLSILTGLFPATSGYALVGGYDIRNEIDSVHLVMGLCPQFDILWDNLTTKEHLLFYARMKGVPSNEEMEHVDQLLREVGLYEARHRFAGQLSGGMKRRLSLAVSMVGYSRIIFLDEPTTGLDPASRRKIWAIISRAKHNRAIVLTTHSMDEAETLCNDIGILAHGYLKCVGSPQHLRSAHGEGYSLVINFEKDDVLRVKKFIETLLPNVTIASEFRTTIEFRIPAKQIRMSELFTILDREGRENCITEWGISQLGLEAVFQRIVDESSANRVNERVEIVQF